MAQDGGAPPASSGPPSRPKCPVCGRRSETTFRPFCSKRCADVDLARWLGGTYAIAGRTDAEEDESVTPDSSPRRLLDDTDEDE